MAINSRPGGGVLLPLLTLLALLLGAGAPLAQGRAPLPIFDTHVHYSRAAWDPFPPDVVEQKLAAAGVPRALVSSSPDDGTLTLVGRDPARFVPELRPYRGEVGSGNWMHDAATPAYLAGRLERGGYKGIGEFHLHSAADARTPVLREVARLAVRHGILLHVHAGAAPVAVLFELEPKVRILWAHAGMSTPPGEVRRMMDAHRNLWAELSFREWEILPGGRLDPAWRALLLAHPDRFMIGTDTYANGRWEGYGELVAGHRRWLALMPPEVAEAIAWRNAARVLGVKMGR
jgi:hypothetical protein